MATELTNHFAYMLATKEIDLEADTLKVVLMESGYSFVKDDDTTYALISSEELAENYGYLQDTKTLGAATVTEDDGNNRCSASFADDATYSKTIGWTAAGGSIGPTPGAIIYDSTTSDNTVVGYIDFGSEQTATDGNDFTIDDIVINISAPTP